MSSSRVSTSTSATDAPAYALPGSELATLWLIVTNEALCGVLPPVAATPTTNGALQFELSNVTVRAAALKRAGLARVGGEDRQAARSPRAA